MDTVYIEKQVLDDPRAKRIVEKSKAKRIIVCEKYTEVFNRKNQSFRLQKQNPALIIARKNNAMIHKIPQSYGIGGSENYYFSHLLNCPFDCQYCFLQGMYRSANYVLFVNYEEFQSKIRETATQNSYFFTGYDADSLALEAKTGFLAEFLPFFESLGKAFFEIRTKSVNIRTLINSKVIQNCIIAYTLSPKIVADEIELRAPSLEKRMNAILKLQEMGWKIGIRFDPIMYIDNFEEVYSDFFKHVFATFSIKGLHSVTIGSFRIPTSLYKNMKQNTYNQKILAYLDKSDSHYEYAKKIAGGLISFCHAEVCKYVNEQKIFLC